TIPIRFDHPGQVVNLGHTQRLFTPKQKIGLATRDGGCRFTGCDRPPSWCEAHHINEWKKDHGRTDIADGIILCKHHHLLTHNNGWRITRDRADYTLTPPESLDPTRTPIPTPPKTAMIHRALAAV
ncbi:MAG: HNH endonuclease, partial [Actinomycetota bacterium]|nr:HNH endonuclease [Actinomycetota bacterium]